jgi:hypothetical protein
LLSRPCEIGYVSGARRGEIEARQNHACHYMNSRTA